jgi:acyl-CoA thioester hydrolase
MNDPRASYRHMVTVAEGDLDELGHVNNAVYLKYVEEVARAHASREGMGLGALKDLGVVPVVHRHLITYHRPAHLGDRLAVSTEVVSMRGARAQRHSEVRLGGLLLVEATTDWVWVDPRRGRPKPVPPAVLEAFGFG